jgi:hypothetical protein
MLFFYVPIITKTEEQEDSGTNGWNNGTIGIVIISVHFF